MNLSNLDPATLAEKALAALLLALFLFGMGFYTGHRFGAADVATLKAQYAKETAQASQQAAAQYTAAVTDAKRREQALNARLGDLDTQRQQEKTNYENTLHDLRGRALAGDVRLRATVAARAVPQCAAPVHSAPAGRPGNAETADLVPSTVAAILGIAGRSGQDVRDYNALLNRYNAAVAMCNGAAP